MSFQILHLNNLFVMPVPRGASLDFEDDGTVGIAKLDEAKELFLFFGQYTFRDGGGRFNCDDGYGN